MSSVIHVQNTSTIRRFASSLASINNDSLFEDESVVVAYERVISDFENVMATLAEERSIKQQALSQAEEEEKQSLEKEVALLTQKIELARRRLKEATMSFDQYRYDVEDLEMEFSSRATKVSEVLVAFVDSLEQATIG